MKAYRVDGANEKWFVGTLKAAQDKAKEYVEQGDDWRDIEIYEVDIPTDKDRLLLLINGWGGDKMTGRQWEFKSARLGLVEVGKQ